MSDVASAEDCHRSVGKLALDIRCEPPYGLGTGVNYPRKRPSPLTQDEGYQTQSDARKVVICATTHLHQIQPMSKLSINSWRRIQ
jgi:hypothetical protein